MGMTMRMEMNMAKGMFRFGFLISSLDWAMISYPSNAMNVRPIAMKILPRLLMPSGSMGKNLSLRFGCVSIALMPKKMNSPRATNFRIVTMFSTLTVSLTP